MKTFASKALATYRRKRDFRRTPEPRGQARPAGKKLHFVIQKHDASHLHYDFRLEWRGVLKSWAVPKGPSLDPSVKSLAIQVEDHPLEYGKFEGTIPEGEYGGGTVLLWDRGEWTPLDDPAKGFRDGRLSFELHGEKLAGRWRLVRIRGSERDRRIHWLLMKSDDENARAGTGYAVLEESPESVKTGRDLDAIAAGKKRLSKSRSNARRKLPRTKSSRRTGARTKVAIDPASLPHARRARQPDWVAPQLATLVDEPPSGEAWVYEIKLDGYRILAVRDGKTVHLWTRNGKDWTAKFPVVADAVGALPVDQAIFDGEIVVTNAQGITEFQALQQFLQNGGRSRLSYAVFDLLYCNGYDLRPAPLLERKKLLAAIVAQTGSAYLQLSEHAAGDGAAALEAACRNSLEGLIFKRGDAAYESRRGRSWLKVKCSSRQEFVIGGFTDPQRSRTGFGSLLLGYHTADGGLRYCGRVGTGFNEKMLADMHERLRKLEQPRTPFTNMPRVARAGGIHWVKPTLVAEVAYRAITHDGILRQPAFEGLRLDKKASEVVREVPRHPPGDEPGRRPTVKKTKRTHENGKLATKSHRRPIREAQSVVKRTGARSRVAKSPGRRTASRGTPVTKRKATAVGNAGASVAGVTLTNADRVLYPELGITKRMLAEYYEQVADAMLPFAAERPLTLVRCPSGLGGEKFYQKHLMAGMPAALEAVRIREKNKAADFIALRDAAGLVALAQFSALEIHGWLSRASDLERPDQVIFDLDPGEGVKWSALVDAALLMRDVLGGCGLTSFVKTSGAKGLHVVAPLRPHAGWGEVKEFAASISRLLAENAPDRFVSKMTKSLRVGKIYVDYLRNERGATCVLAYSTRAREGAPVSMPVAWRNLKGLGGSDAFDIRTAPGRIRKEKNPWPEYGSLRQTLSAKVVARVGR